MMDDGICFCWQSSFLHSCLVHCVMKYCITHAEGNILSILLDHDVKRESLRFEML